MNKPSHTMDIPLKAKIFIKQDPQGSTGKLTTLLPVHVTSGSAQDTKYRVECPVWSKFEESPFDVVQSVAFDGENLVYSTEGKKKTTMENSPLAESDFILKVEIEYSDWCAIRIRVSCGDSEELEGEVLFVKPLTSLDGNLKMAYNVVLFMDPNSSNIARRVKHQQISYLETALGSFDFDLLMERRNKLDELCREMQLQMASCNDRNESGDFNEK